MDGGVTLGESEPETKYSMFQSYFLLGSCCFLSARKSLPNTVGATRNSCHQEFDATRCLQEAVVLLEDSLDLLLRKDLSCFLPGVAI